MSSKHQSWENQSLPKNLRKSSLFKERMPELVWAARSHSWKNKINNTGFLLVWGKGQAEAGTSRGSI